MVLSTTPAATPIRVFGMGAIVFHDWAITGWQCNKASANAELTKRRSILPSLGKVNVYTRPGLSRARRLLAIADSSLRLTIRSSRCVMCATRHVSRACWTFSPREADETCSVAGRSLGAVKKNNLFLSTVIHKQPTACAQLIHRPGATCALVLKSAPAHGG